MDLLSHVSGLDCQWSDTATDKSSAYRPRGWSQAPILPGLQIVAWRLVRPVISWVACSSLSEEKAAPKFLLRISLAASVTCIPFGVGAVMCLRLLAGSCLAFNKPLPVRSLICRLMLASVWPRLFAIMRC